MLAPSTAAKIAQGLDRLRADQAEGKAPAPGAVSLRVMARYCGVSPGTISAMERVINAKLVTALLERHADDMPAEIAEQLRDFLS